MPIIAVLEDDQRRITVIRAVANQHFGHYELLVFVSAREMIKWLINKPHDVKIILLDCDLDSTAIYDCDCGAGEDVTAYLASNLPDCPVMIHSSNAMRAPAMPQPMRRNAAEATIATERPIGSELMASRLPAAG